MSVGSGLIGGVIAAGEGRRLREDGWPMPKPLVPVAGVPLLASVVGNFAAAGVRSIVAIVNEDERECVEWARGRFPDVDLEFIVKTTRSSLESFLEVAQHGGARGPILISTVDAWCPPADFARFVKAARSRPGDATVLGLTPVVADESPLWARMAPDGRVTELGAASGDLVTAGFYLVPERVRRRPAPAGLGRLRELLGWLVRSGEPVYGEVVPTVVDVDRSSDVALAEALARGETGLTPVPGASAPRATQERTERPRTEGLRVTGAKAGCWGVFRERAHSPGREVDDGEILRLTGKHLEERGFDVVLKSPDELSVPGEVPPASIFLMCEGAAVLRQLAAWEAAGVRQVNRPGAVLDTYRERMIARLGAAGVAFISSAIVATDGSGPRSAAPDVPFPLWVKRPDVHNTQEGDVVLADGAPALRAALGALAARGIARAVLQPHVAGDLVKFYGIGRPGEPARWFRWFHHRDQVLAGHPVDRAALARLAEAGAAALGLEVYGGDAIVTAGGGLVLLDINAWPSFALYRDEASAAIAAYLADAFGGRSGR